MRKVAIVVAIIVAAIMGVVYVVGVTKAQMAPKPPVLRVSAGAKRIPVMLGSYSWKTLLKGVCADAPAPLDMLKKKDYATAVLPTGEVLKLTFDVPPTDLSIHWWVQGMVHTERLGRGTKNVSFPSMTVPGVYPLALDATWDRGHASYYFQIETANIQR